MQQLIRLTGLTFAANRVRQNLKRAAFQWVTAAAAVAVAVVGGGFLIQALWVYLAIVFDPIAASLWIGGGFIALAVLILLIGWMVSPRTAPRPSPALAVSPDAIAKELSVGSLAGYRVQAVAVAVLTGFAIGRVLMRK